MEHLNSLRLLDLSRNNFAQIPKCVGNMKSLVGLDVSFNKIKALENRHLPKTLQQLHMQENNVLALPNDIGVKLKKLVYLNCASNYLKALPESSK